MSSGAESSEQHHLSSSSSGGSGSGDKASKKKMSSGGAMAAEMGIPSGALERILVRLDRDDVARSCAVCRRWNRVICSEAFQRVYRKQHGKQPMTWEWLASIKSAQRKKTPGGDEEHVNAEEEDHCQQQQQQPQDDRNEVVVVAEEADKEEDERRRFQLVAWNLQLRRSFTLLDIACCPAAPRSHPDLCWLEFAATSGGGAGGSELLAWACRHTPTSIRVAADPLHPSSVRIIPAPPAFPDPVVYEFRLGLARDNHHLVPGQPSSQHARLLPSSLSSESRGGGGFKLALLRLGFPHADSATAHAWAVANVYHSATRQWSSFKIKLDGDLKRWGASVVCKGHLYVLLRPPGRHGPGVGLISLNMSAAVDPFGYHDVVLPGFAYEWHDVMDLVDRSGTLLLVVFSFAKSSLSIFQAEDAAPSRMSRTATSRWLPLSTMPGGACAQFCKELETQWSYRCRGSSECIFFANTRGGPGFVFWITRKSWHRMHFPDVDSRYLFALSV